MANVIELQGCEACSKESPIETMRPMDDCWFCAECAADFDRAFAACKHNWKPEKNGDGAAGQYCNRCGAFVHDEDMPLVKS